MMYAAEIKLHINTSIFYFTVLQIHISILLTMIQSNANMNIRNKIAGPIQQDTQ